MHPGKTCFLSLLGFLAFYYSNAQNITGVWKGKINREKVEVKIIQRGDSLTGTSYYYESPNNFRRYSIRGYFDAETNAVHWWDDQLIETGPGMKNRNPMLSIADFNCPGEGKMLLEGKSSFARQPGNTKGPVDLSKTSSSNFPDEWDFVIDNYTSGANHPEVIDSIALIARTSEKPPAPPVYAKKETPPPAPKKGMVTIPPMPQKDAEPRIALQPKTIEQKFIERKKVFSREIPLAGDSIELRFYDNAEIDGDSITLFLNNKMIFTHIRLSNVPYVVKFAVNEMDEENELIMVAENLGSIPPNTAYMMAIVKGERYEAYLSSTEETSAMIRLKKPEKSDQ